MSLVRYALLLPIVIIFRICWMEHALEIIQAFTLSSRRDFITILCEHLVILDCFWSVFGVTFFVAAISESNSTLSGSNSLFYFVLVICFHYLRA